MTKEARRSGTCMMNAAHRSWRRKEPKATKESAFDPKEFLRKRRRHARELSGDERTKVRTFFGLKAVSYRSSFKGKKQKKTDRRGKGQVSNR